jgi:ATP/maltotriose-dependent transcriptional regulator MalT
VIVERKVFVTQEEEFKVNESELEKLNLSSREFEVLQLLAKGHSKTDIAKNLFLSLSTIKTHDSNLYIKKEVKSRLQAIEKAKIKKKIE